MSEELRTKKSSSPWRSGKVPNDETMKKIERVSVTDAAVKSIRALIAGETTPREASCPPNRKSAIAGRRTLHHQGSFRVLQAIGLVELRPGKGAFVRRKTMDGQETIRQWFIDNRARVDELMELRMGIEPLAAKLAITRGSQKQLDQIRTIHQEFRRAVEEGDVIKMATIDESFHDAIMEASNNRLLKRTGNMIADALMEYRTRSFAVAENKTHAVIPHQRIIDALAAKDEKEVVQAMLDHLQISLKDMNGVAELDGKRQ